MCCCFELVLGGFIGGVYVMVWVVDGLVWLFEEGCLS